MTNKKFIILLVFSICVLNSFIGSAQQWNLLKAFPTDSFYYANNAQDDDGNIYLVGSYSDSIAVGNITLHSEGLKDIFVFKFNRNGNVVWGQSIGNEQNNGSSAIGIDKDKNVIVVGGFLDTLNFGNDTLVSRGGTDIAIFKLDSLGHPIWSRCGGSYHDDLCDFDNNTFGQQVAVDDDGDIYIATRFSLNFGITDSLYFGSSSIPSYGASDAALIKLNKNGNLLLLKHAGGIGSDQGSNICVDKNKNIYFSGSNEFNKVYFGDDSLINSTLVSRMNYIVKMDSNGNTLWANGIYSPSLTGSFGLVDFAVDSKGNVYTTGRFDCPQLVCGINGPSTTLNLASGNGIFVVKFDELGIQSWTKMNSCGGYAIGQLVEVDNNDRVYFFGVIDTGPTSFGGDTLNSSDWGNMFSWICDSSGSELGYHYYGSSNDGPYGISKSTNGDICIDGTMFNSILKFDSLSFTSSNQWNIYFARFSPSWITSISHQENVQNILLYPNPFNEYFILNDNEEEKEIEVINTVGQHVYLVKTRNIKTIIPTLFWPRGMYTVVIRKENSIISKQILIKR